MRKFMDYLYKWIQSNTKILSERGILHRFFSMALALFDIVEK
jgi:hypothetical protein